MSIYIKTKMRSMPECCGQCQRYESSGKSRIWPKACNSPMGRMSLEDVDTAKERSKHCPLVEITTKKEQEEKL